jgi:2-dehydropantoate 2-reductase
MKIGIVGPGAMGLSLAYFLKRSGCEPVLVARNAAAAAGIRAGAEFSGFPPGGASSKERLSFDATDDPGRLGEAGAVIFLVKAYDTETAAASLRGILRESCVVASLQNGLGNAEILASAFPSNPLVIGSIALGAFRTGPFSVGYGGPGEVVVADVSGCGAADVAEALSRAGIQASLSSDPARTVWEKAVLNAAINPIAALVNAPNGAILKSEALLSLQRDVVREAVSVARARGAEIDGEAMARRVLRACERTAGNICSMVQDIRAGRRTEIDAINGRIAAYAREENIPAPVNETLARLVRAIEGKAPLAEPRRA